MKLIEMQRWKKSCSTFVSWNKKLIRDKDVGTNECEKLEQELHKSIKERSEIELTAQNLSKKLERLQNEKEQLEAEYNENEAIIEEYNMSKNVYRTELENMKSVLSTKPN